MLPIAQLVLGQATVRHVADHAVPQHVAAGHDALVGIEAYPADRTVDDETAFPAQGIAGERGRIVGAVQIVEIVGVDPRETQVRIGQYRVVIIAEHQAGPRAQVLEGRAAVGAHAKRVDAVGDAAHQLVVAGGDLGEFAVAACQVGRARGDLALEIFTPATQLGFGRAKVVDQAGEVLRVGQRLAAETFSHASIVVALGLDAC
ncbi:MAG: hypothetical protein IPJ24_15985 [bacterium]|nr:hypothetical protein [bacterium]